jgi:UDP-N-acetylmuramoyl-tripeptide--D-alanyl-D-alanine ligase
MRKLPRHGLAMLNGDDSRVLAMANGARYRVSTFGTSDSNDVWADQVSASWPGRLEFWVHAGDESCRVRTRLVGTHWMPSVLAALATARQCGITLEQAGLALESHEPFTARMEPVQLPQGATMLRDEYNGSMATLQQALRVMREAKARRRVAVIGNISDAEETGVELSERVGREVAAAADFLVFLGPNSRYSAEAAKAAGVVPQSVRHFESTPAAADFLRNEITSGDLVLLKAVYDDHLSRVYFHQFGTVGCWKTVCKKSILCDECKELKFEKSRKL